MAESRHAKREPGFMSGGTCGVCQGKVTIAEAMKVRPGQVAFGPPTHDDCYEADVIVMGSPT